MRGRLTRIDDNWEQTTFRVIFLIFIWFIGVFIYSRNGKGEIYTSKITFLLTSFVDGANNVLKNGGSI